MATHTLTLPDGELEFENEGNWVYSNLPEPDPNWRGADSNGHEHYYAEGANRYPTLKVVAGEPYWCDDCEEEHTDTWYECPICGEQVTPGTRTPGPVWVSAGSRYFWNGELISNERANEIMAEVQRVRDEAARITERPAIGTRVRLLEDGEVVEVTVVPTDPSVPADHVTVMRDGTGAMEATPLDRLRHHRGRP